MTTPIATPKKTLTRRGFFKLAGTELLMVTHPTIFLPKRSVITRSWGTATPAQILADINRLMTDVCKCSVMPTRIFLNPAAYSILCNIPLYNDSDLPPKFNLEDL